MTPKQILFAAFICFFSIVSISAQEFVVPENYSLVAAEDYEPYKQDVLNAIQWLETTPLNEQHDKRKEVSAFFMKWVTGSPTVSISLMPYVLDLSEKNAELLSIFLGGWTKASIEQNYKITDTQGNIAGIKSILNFYSKNRKAGIIKNKVIEKLLKQKTDKNLEKWLEKNSLD
ncbi:hypothetical protein [Psychroserpens mesophilus]|uniref:hypothetical protein n=1 Tax=Psychroserpens mesophilus TaxID=325473 RepID=UPI003F492DAE